MCKQVTEMPSAFITVNKGRKKIKEDKYVYLNNGQEFELELMNPTQDNVLTKIWINNIQMSSSGIILRPGERVFLERYIDIPKKFLFDTYEVAGDNTSVQKAIEKNGLVRVEFFSEDTTPSYNNGHHIQDYDNLTWISPPQTTKYNGVVGSTTDLSSLFGGTLSTTGLIGFSSVNNSFTATQVNPLKKEFISKPRNRGIFKKSKSIETGRVEEGSNSNQTFEYVSKKFLLWAFKTVEYQIKPTSTLVIEAKDLVSKYCTGCGKKAKSMNKFCSNCGTKL